MPRERAKWMRDQREAKLLTLAVAYQATYRNDPVHMTQQLLTELGKDDARSVIGWIETMECNSAPRPFIDTNATIDESGGLDPYNPVNFDPKEAA
jgi:hypothetical protein